MKKLISSAFIVATIGLLTVSSVDAATVVWGAATTVAADSDVSTNGTLVRAYVFGAAPVSNVINSVNFQISTTGLSHTFNSVAPLDAYATSATPFANLSSAYRALLGNGVHGSDAATRTVTLSGLITGATYEVQIWTNDSRGTFSGRSATVSAGNSRTLNYGTAAGTVGQFVIGTFVADGNQTIAFDSITSPQINGLQLRLIAVPEPASALLGATGLGLIALRRRRA